MDSGVARPSTLRSGAWLTGTPFDVQQRIIDLALQHVERMLERTDAESMARYHLIGIQRQGLDLQRPGISFTEQRLIFSWAQEELARHDSNISVSDIAVDDELKYLLGYDPGIMM